MDTTLTIKNLDQPSMEWINQKAKLLGIDLEEVIVQLIHEQIESDEREPKLKQYHDLDSLAGTWSNEESEEFFQATENFNQVDESLWQ